MDEEKIDHGFTDEEKKILNSVSLLKKADAVFIRHLLEFLYKDNLKLLQRRSFSGQTRKRKRENANEPQQNVKQEAFKAISPMKKMIIFSEFTKRIENSNIPKQEQYQRLANDYVAQKIAWGIDNIRKMDKKTL